MNLNEKQQYKQKFNKAFFSVRQKIAECEPKLEDWKNFRMRFLRILITIFLIFITLMLILIFKCSELMQFGIAVIVLSIFLLRAIIRTVTSICAKSYSNIIKKSCFDELLNVFDFLKKGLDSQYSIYSETIVKESDSKQRKNRILIHTDDEFHGIYKDVKFNITELTSGMIRGKNAIYHGPWSGVVINLEMQKSVANEINITPNSDKKNQEFLIIGLLLTGYAIFVELSTSLIAGLSILLIGILFIAKYYKGFGKVNLEDVSFEKNYYVECKNQIDARYILTPAFMERLNELKSVFNTRGVYISIRNRNISFAFSTDRDLFEIGDIKYRADDTSQAEQFFNEVIAITDIIDHFKLNERTGL